MVCRACGTDINIDDKFCKNCGEVNDQYIEQVEVETTQQQEVTYPMNQDNFLRNSQSTISAQERRKIEEDNKTSLILGIISTTLAFISFFILGIMSFVTLPLSIVGLTIANKGAKKGYKDATATTFNIIGIILSSISAFLMLILFSMI